MLRVFFGDRLVIDNKPVISDKLNQIDITLEWLEPPAESGVFVRSCKAL